MKLGHEVLADVQRLRQEMCEFLVENRAANVTQGLPPVGPAAKAIEKELQEALSTVRSIMYPDDA